MGDVVQILKELPDFYSLTGASKEEIMEAERKLGVAFSEDYIDYVSAFGAVSAAGHELTGICAAARLNVVNVTEDERKTNCNALDSWYVLEQANIDGIVIWQSEKGEIYKTMPSAEPVKICGSFMEYIEKFLK